MKIAVLGTGIVARTVAPPLAELGHQVVFGTRDPVATRERIDHEETFGAWLGRHPGIELLTYADAGAWADVLVNATNGAASEAALTAVGADNLAGTVVLDLSNPLDFGQGFPPSFFVTDTDSLAERLQRAFPTARVVKTLNTLTAALMVDPGTLAGGDHTIFVAGDDPDAKQVAIELLRGFGWTDIIDLGDLSTARGAEMYVGLWVRLMGALGTPHFNLKVVR